MPVDIEASWFTKLADEFDKDYFSSLVTFLKKDKSDWQTIYPPWPLIFNAFALTPFDSVKVVVLWQDPYHGVGQAMWLCFSVPSGIVLPPSLVNIFKELVDDVGVAMSHSGDLTQRAKQWVFLLNTILTVRAGHAASHRDKGREIFADAVIRLLSDQKRSLVFLLWWKFAQSKRSLIDSSKHTILTAAHPSPLSAYHGWFGCKHFSATNAALVAGGITPIDRRL